MARTSKLRKAWHQVRKRIISPFIVENGDYRKTVLLAGSGRSGTTWVSGIINHDGAYRYVFEPFRPSRVPAVRAFNRRQYLRPQNRDARFLAPARAVLSGRVKNAWVDAHNRRLLVRRRLVKDIRAHLLLRWIRAHFPEIPIVLLLRHPCAVAHSRLQMGWESPLGVFLEQEALMEDHLAPFAALLRTATDPFERGLLMWCAEQYVPLRQFGAGEIHVAFYERFCTDPEAETQRLFSFLKRPFAPSVRKTFRRPSATARRASAVHRNQDPVTHWQGHLGPAQVERAAALLARFGLDRLYSARAPLPRVEDRDAVFAS